MMLRLCVKWRPGNHALFLPSCQCSTKRKNFEHFHSFPSSDASGSKQAIAIVRLYENKPFQNAFKLIQHYIYLFKLYSISIILFLRNTLTNICSKISKIGINSWMV